MNREERLQRKLEQLEKAQEQANERMAEARERMNQQFERARARMKRGADTSSEMRQRIVTAALELLDEDGLNELSMRKLAAKVSMQAPALYWHFKNKESLIDHMAEAILQSEFVRLEARRPDEAWQDWLVEICTRLRGAMQAHRDGARVVAGAHLYPAITLMKLFEISMESLTSAGVELQRANLIITTATHFVFGNVIEEQAAPALEEIDDFIHSNWFGAFPLMKQSLDQTVEAAKNGHDEFEDALRLIVGYPDA